MASGLLTDCACGPSCVLFGVQCLVCTECCLGMGEGKGQPEDPGRGGEGGCPQWAELYSPVSKTKEKKEFSLDTCMAGFRDSDNVKRKCVFICLSAMKKEK